MNDNYILFSVAGTTYALPASEVAHVEMVEQITPVPNAPPFVDGVVFSRGQVVPALNLRARFGFERVADDLRTRLLVVRRDGRMAGLLVDAAREFVVIPPRRYPAAREGLARHERALSRAGSRRSSDRMILILDLAEVLNLGEALPADDSEPAAWFSQQEHVMARRNGTSERPGQRAHAAARHATDHRAGGRSQRRRRRHRPHRRRGRRTAPTSRSARSTRRSAG